MFGFLRDLLNFVLILNILLGIGDIFSRTCWGGSKLGFFRICNEAFLFNLDFGDWIYLYYLCRRGRFVNFVIGRCNVARF